MSNTPSRVTQAAPGPGCYRYGKPYQTKSEPPNWRRNDTSVVEAKRPLQDTQSERLPPLSFDLVSSPPVHSVIKKQLGSFIHQSPCLKRSHQFLESAHPSPLIEAWLSDLPEREEFEYLGQPETVNTMHQPPLKRLRLQSPSSGMLDRGISQPSSEMETMVSRSKKYAAYRDSNYEVVLSNKDSYGKPSPNGMVEEDQELWNKILTTTQPIPNDLLFDDDHSESFFSSLCNRSESRIYIDLHPRLVPSVENLSITGYKEFDCLIDGYNDAWIKCLPFYGPRPQPDHTIAFKSSAFTKQQRQKLGIEPLGLSKFIAREDMYFPFFTSEVKCDSQSLVLADRANLHSMTVAMRGMVELYGKVRRAADMHRRLAGISISHDSTHACIYAHYPEIEDGVTYWRTHSETVTFRHDNGQHRWRCYQIMLNVCKMFALPLLQRLRAIIDELPDPEQSEDISVYSNES